MYFSSILYRNISVVPWQIAQLEQEYAESLKCVGTAHSQADELDLGLEQKAVAMQENSKRAEERYTAAIAKVTGRYCYDNW